MALTHHFQGHNAIKSEMNTQRFTLQAKELPSASTCKVGRHGDAEARAALPKKVGLLDC